MADPWEGNGPCGICGMPVPVATVLCPVCGETNESPVQPREPEQMGRCGICGMPVPVGTGLCPVCGETNDPPVAPEQPEQMGSCRSCGMPVPVGTTLCPICNEVNDPPVEETQPDPDFTCPHCGMQINRRLAEADHACPVCGEDPLEPQTTDEESTDPIDHLPGDAPEPPIQPLGPEAQGIVAETLAGLATAGVDIGSSYTITDARIDGDGNTRVDISVPVGADGKPLPPIAARQGEAGAVAILVIEATATHKHARLVAVDSNRIYKSSSAWSNTGAFTDLVSGGRFVVPKRRATGKVAAVAGIVLIAGVGIVLLLGGGDDETNTETGSGTTAPQDDEVEGPETGAVSTAPDDLAQAVLPADGLPWVAFKSEEITPPPDPIQPLPRGHRFQGTFTMTEDCSTDPCTYTTPMDVGAAIVIGTLPDVPWEQLRGVWYLDSVADVQSSNTGGLRCVYHRTQSWGITPTEVAWDGTQWVMSAGEGTMLLEQNLDPGLSAAAIAKGYCPPYAEASGWTAFVATDAASLPTAPP